MTSSPFSHTRHRLMQNERSSLYFYLAQRDLLHPQAQCLKMWIGQQTYGYKP